MTTDFGPLRSEPARTRYYSVPSHIGATTAIFCHLRNHRREMLPRRFLALGRSIQSPFARRVRGISNRDKDLQKIFQPAPPHARELSLAVWDAVSSDSHVSPNPHLPIAVPLSRLLMLCGRTDGERPAYRPCCEPPLSTGQGRQPRHWLGSGVGWRFLGSRGVAAALRRCCGLGPKWGDRLVVLVEAAGDAGKDSVIAFCKGYWRRGAWLRSWTGEGRSSGVPTWSWKGK